MGSYVLGFQERDQTQVALVGGKARISSGSQSWKQSDLARLTDISRARISRIERKVRGLRDSELERLSSLLECPPRRAGRIA